MKLFKLDRTIDDGEEVVKMCLDFLVQNGGCAIEIGKHFVKDEEIFLNVTEYVTRLPENGKWEAHREYADLQLVLKGEEQIDVSNINKMEVGEYEQHRDYLPCFGEAEASYVLDEDNGILLMPEDAHKPCMSIDGKTMTVKKAVFKIPVSYFEK